MKLNPDSPFAAHSFAVCMGFDAFRICIGAHPQNFTKDEVLRWLTLMCARLGPSHQRHGG